MFRESFSLALGLYHITPYFAYSGIGVKRLKGNAGTYSSKVLGSSGGQAFSTFSTERKCSLVAETQQAKAALIHQDI